jgi:hypothetical protein
VSGLVSSGEGSMVVSWFRSPSTIRLIEGWPGVMR